MIGALIGKQKGRNLEIMNSFELVFNVIDGRDVIIDRDYYNTKEEQCELLLRFIEFIFLDIPNEWVLRYYPCLNSTTIKSNNHFTKFCA